MYSITCLNCTVLSALLIFSFPASQASGVSKYSIAKKTLHKVDKTSSKLKPLKLNAASGGPKLELGSPDLIVSRLEFVNKEIRFRVKNIGRGVKKPGRLMYRLQVQTLNTSNRPVSSRTYTGVAALATLSRLARGQESGDNRLTRVSLPLNMRVTLCINKSTTPGQLLLESNYANNCLTKNSRQLLPDLEVMGGRLFLAKPREKKGLIRRIGEFWWDVVTLDTGFDVRGIKYNQVIVHIRNNGDVALAHFKIAVGVSIPGSPGGKTFYADYRKPLLPGRIVRASVYVGPDKARYKNKNCCLVIVAADPYDRIREVNESNNKKSLPVIREGNIRDHR